MVIRHYSSGWMWLFFRLSRYLVEYEQTNQGVRTVKFSELQSLNCILCSHWQYDNVHHH